MHVQEIGKRSKSAPQKISSKILQKILCCPRITGQKILCVSTVQHWTSLGSRKLPLGGSIVIEVCGCTVQDLMIRLYTVQPDHHLLYLGTFPCRKVARYNSDKIRLVAAETTLASRPPPPTQEAAAGLTCVQCNGGSLNLFLATLVALHFTPVSKWVSEQSFGLA